LDRRHAADVATIESLQQGRATAATLPYEQIERLFTVHGLKLNRLTRADGQGITVHAVPIDQEGEDLKAAGSFTVEAWQADRTDGPPLVKCEYTLDQSRAVWRGQLLMYEYVLQCPWQTAPSGNSIKIRVNFRDALTGREFTAEKLVEREQGER
jgi:hypothetical protein